MQVLEQHRVHPASSSSLGAQRIQLSTIDATVLRFSPTGIVLFYKTQLSTPNLRVSLERTLDSYPQWAGQLRFVQGSPSDSGSPAKRYGELVLEFGMGDEDPGVHFSVVESSSRSMATFVPKPVDGHWEAGHLPYQELLNQHESDGAPLALHDVKTYEGLPCMVVQVTKFKDGTAVGVKLCHPLADAQALLQFCKDWVGVNAALLTGSNIPTPSPIFDPSMLDDHAQVGTSPDPSLMEIASALPQHRYDWWASAEGAPPFMEDGTRIPANLSSSAEIDPGKPLPWHEWDYTLPVSHQLIDFTSQEIDAIYKAASSRASTRISRLDALLAHLWSLIIRARDIEGEEEHYLDVTLGLRPRLSPPLSDSFVGSPITIAKVVTSGSPSPSQEQPEDALASLGQRADSIRRTLTQFNEKTIPAMLHALSHDAGAQRYWNAFLGRRHVIVTSWLRIGIYDVVFEAGERPVHVEAVMPNVDGCLQIMEAGPGQNQGAGGRWYDDGVRVSLHLEKGVVEKVLRDPALRNPGPDPGMKSSDE